MAAMVYLHPSVMDMLAYHILVVSTYIPTHLIIPTVQFPESLSTRYSCSVTLEVKTGVVLSISHCRYTFQAFTHRLRQSALILNTIRRLPSETLVEIFGLWRDGVEPLFRRDHYDGIAMDTRSFWTYVDLDEKLLYSFRATPERIVKTLAAVLGRSRGAPLHVVIDGHVPPPAVEILTDLSERWKTARIGRLLHDEGRHLWYRIFQKLPILENLELRPHYATFKSFELPPNLRSFTVPGHLLKALCGPLPAQLHTLHCVNLGPKHMSTAIALLSQFPNTRGKCALVIDDDCESEAEIPPFSSNISSLSIEAGPDPSAKASSFHEHLVSLEVHDILLTDAQLLEILATLPSLERLTISDRVSWFGSVVQHLITDNLLTNLTLIPDSPCLVPRLRFLSIHTILKFDDKVYLQFVSSRIGDERRFEGEIRGVQAVVPVNGRRYTRDLDAAVAAQIGHFRAEGRLVLSYKQPEQAEVD
ncbi:hypothetical protein C8R43DRAFT_1113466 [Mycena crocata]|nr:hypothetical protein C8R43DRAFT_1113466 [Mycena crocata]